MSENKHAILSPSGAVRWMHCVGAAALERMCPDDSSEYADEGTAAHTLAARCLENEAFLDARTFIGERIAVGHRTFEVTDDFAAGVNTYVQAIKEKVEGYRLTGATSVALRVEVKVPIGHITGEQGAEGTADAVIVVLYSDGSGTLDVNDLKFGRGVPVHAVYPEPDEGEDRHPEPLNEQLLLYTAGALREFELLGDFRVFRGTIHQPRLGHVSSFETDLDTLTAFTGRARKAADLAFERMGMPFTDAVEYFGPDLRPLYRPSAKSCRFCKAKAICPGLRQQVAAAVAVSEADPSVIEDFEDLSKPFPAAIEQGADLIPHLFGDRLGRAMHLADLAEVWITAIRARTESELLSGRKVTGFKLVQGRKGNRKWTDAEEAEAMLKTFRLKSDEMYDKTVISPTTAEKRLADSPRKWAKLQNLIVRADGKPSVAPESDPRPALPSVAEEFEDLSGMDGIAGGEAGGASASPPAADDIADML